MSIVCSRLSALYWSVHSRSWDDYLQIPECREEIEASTVWILRHLSGGRKRVLDVGCGTGNYTLALAAHGCDMVGLDFSAGMLRRARSKATRDGAHNAVFQQTDFDWPLPFPSESFDGVIAVAVLQCAAEPRSLLAEVRRVLRPGGAFLLWALNPEQRSRAKRRLSPSLGKLALRGLRTLRKRFGNVRKYSRDELAVLLTDAGFALVDERRGEERLGLLSLAASSEKCRCG